MLRTRKCSWMKKGAGIPVINHLKHGKLKHEYCHNTVFSPCLSPLKYGTICFTLRTTQTCLNYSVTDGECFISVTLPGRLETD